MRHDSENGHKFLGAAPDYVKRHSLSIAASPAYLHRMDSALRPLEPATDSSFGWWSATSSQRRRKSLG